MRLIPEPTTAPAPAPAAASGPLEALAIEAEGLTVPAGDGAAPGDPGAPGGDAPAVPAMTNAQCLMMGAQIVRETLGTLAKLQSPAVTMADAKLQPAADALGAVFDKHGWSLQGMAGDYGAELAALAATAPLAWSVHQGIKAEIAARPKAGKKTDAEIDEQLREAGWTNTPKGPPGLAVVAPGVVTEFPKGDPRNVRLQDGGA